MKTSRITLTLLLVALPAITQADGRAVRLRADLIGFEEVPSVSTPAHGRFRARIAQDGESIDYELSYSDLVGTVQQSHIHFGQKSVNGGIVIWLCQTTTTRCWQPWLASRRCARSRARSPGRSRLPTWSRRALRHSRSTHGELDEVIDAIKGGVVYVNVHATPLNRGGEIRGQIKRVD